MALTLPLHQTGLARQRAPTHPSPVHGTYAALLDARDALALTIGDIRLPSHRLQSQPPTRLLPARCACELQTTAAPARRWRWRWIRARRCVASTPFLPCLPYIHAPGRPSLTQPSHTALAQRRRCLKVKSDTQALRSGPCPCPQTQVQLHDRDYDALHPGTLRGTHDILPTQVDGSSSTHLPQGALESHRICVRILIPDSGHTPPLSSRFKLDCTTLPAHVVPAPAILLPPTPSLPSFTPFP
ncbi:hypothetical protein B0H14DRAFT_2865824, partial [Mycena olivaceomarginata]